MTRRFARLVTNDVGEAMAPASGFRSTGGIRSGAGAALILLLVACGDDSSRAPPPPSAPAKSRGAADSSREFTTELDGPAPGFGSALLAELTGDAAAARDGYERVLAAPDAPAGYAARAALHLAQMEARAGKHRALDLVARAAALAPSDDAVREGIAQVRADIAAQSSAGGSRGPALGATLPGVEPKVADAFAAAEQLLAAVRRHHPRPFEVLLGTTSDALVVARYRAIAEAGGLAQVAADYRIGSLYQDVAFGLLSELPSQLDPSVAALRPRLRAYALDSLRRAVTAYEACLAGPASPESELWRLHAETDLRSAKDVLAEAGER